MGKIQKVPTITGYSFWVTSGGTKKRIASVSPWSTKGWGVKFYDAQGVERKYRSFYKNEPYDSYIVGWAEDVTGEICEIEEI